MVNGNRKLAHAIQKISSGVLNGNRKLAHAIQKISSGVSGHYHAGTGRNGGRRMGSVWMNGSEIRKRKEKWHGEE